MGCINARSDQTVAKVITCIERSVGIRSIERIDIKRIVQLVLFGKLDKP